MTGRIALVGCGKQKLDLSGDTGPVTISRLYTSNYFELKREYAKECCDRYYILSAKYGLVQPGYYVEEPYDLTIGDLDEDELAVWEDDVIDDLQLLRDDATIVFLAGGDYFSPLANTLQSPEFGPRVVLPFSKTSGIGEQMAWLRDEIDAAQSNNDAEHANDNQADLGEWSA